MKSILSVFEKFILCFHALIDSHGKTISLRSQSKTVISAYIIDELTKLFIASKKIFLRRYSVFLSCSKESKKKYRILRFYNAITLIDRHIGDEFSEIAKKEAPYNAQREKIVLLRDAAQSKNIIHLIRMYDIKLIDIDTEKILVVNNEYIAIIHLLSEKIRILKKALAYQDKLQCRYLLRMQYYYDKVCRFNNSYTITSLNVKDYYDLIDMSFLGCYETQLLEAQKLLDDIINHKKDVKNIPKREDDESVEDSFAFSVEEEK